MLEAILTLILGLGVGFHIGRVVGPEHHHAGFKVGTKDWCLDFQDALSASAGVPSTPSHVRDLCLHQHTPDCTDFVSSCTSASASY
jgi:hypothetical protein